MQLVTVQMSSLSWLSRNQFQVAPGNELTFNELHFRKLYSAHKFYFPILIPYTGAHTIFWYAYGRALESDSTSDTTKDQLKDLEIF